MIASTNKNKISLENYKEFWDEIKEQIKLVSSDEVNEYSKDFKG